MFIFRFPQALASNSANYEADPCWLLSFPLPSLGAEQNFMPVGLSQQLPSRGPRDEALVVLESRV